MIMALVTVTASCFFQFPQLLTLVGFWSFRSGTLCATCKRGRDQLMLLSSLGGNECDDREFGAEERGKRISYIYIYSSVVMTRISRNLGILCKSRRDAVPS